MLTAEPDAGRSILAYRAVAPKSVAINTRLRRIGSPSALTVADYPDTTQQAVQARAARPRGLSEQAYMYRHTGRAVQNAHDFRALRAMPGRLALATPTLLLGGVLSAEGKDAQAVKCP